MGRILLIVLCMGSAACQPNDAPDAAQIGTPERATRDSIIGQSQLPGAKAVDRALDVQSTAQDRAAALDSIK